ncbi:hypothetical protein T484DRAFT_1981401, partial [Baffinella frigidus]
MSLPQPVEAGGILRTAFLGWLATVLPSVATRAGMSGQEELVQVSMDGWSVPVMGPAEMDPAEWWAEPGRHIAFHPLLFSVCQAHGRHLRISLLSKKISRSLCSRQPWTTGSMAKSLRMFWTTTPTLKPALQTVCRLWSTACR